MSIEFAEIAKEPEPDVIEELGDSLHAFYLDKARSIWPRGTTLRCPRCQRTQTATVGEIANHLARGWPTCHGEAMHVGDLPSN